ncbi:MAG TPA: DnaJ family domain-containing protein, partial [Bdellovibrio sp.]
FAEKHYSGGCSMNLIADWIEQKIQEAMAKGEFDNLPGAGKPMDLEDDAHVPQELRMSFRVLKNAGFLPPELVLHQEVQELRDKLSANKDLPFEQYQALKKKLVQKECELNMAFERIHRKG